MYDQKNTPAGAAADAKTDTEPTKKDGLKDDLRGMEYEDQQQALDPEAKEKKGEEEAAGKQSNFETELRKQYTAQFGSKLGGKLYELVTEHLGPDALMGYAKKGLEEGLKSLTSLVDDAAIKGKLDGVWGPKAKEIAAQIVDGNPAVQKILTGLSNFTREHPYGLIALAVATAVLAGMKVYSDNIDIPALKGMVPLGKNVKIGGEIDLGHIQNITIDSLHAYLQVHTSRFQAKLDVGHEKGEGEDEAGTLNVDLDGSLTLLEDSGKELDEITGKLKREYATKLTTTFGSSFKYNEDDWSLDALKLAWGVALEAKDKRLVSQSKLGELERSEYRETVFKLYANVLQKYKNVEGMLSSEETSLALGLSMVMNKRVELKGKDAAGKDKIYNLDPLKYGFNWGLNYKDSPLNMEPGRSIGTEAGVFVEKGNWSLGASVDYSRDLMRNENNFGGKLTFSIKF